MAEVHHALELGLNACGVECCPHPAYRRLVAVASYLHRPGDDDEPQSRVGQLFLYNLTPEDDDDDIAPAVDAAEEGREKRKGKGGVRGWLFEPAAPVLDTRAIFELKWAPAAYTTSTGPVLAQADAGGYLTLYAVDATAATAAAADDNDDDDDGGIQASASASASPVTLRELTKLECGGGGLGMTTCVDWNPASGGGGGGGHGDGDTEWGEGSGDGNVGGCGGAGCDLAVCGADGGIRVVALRESGDLEVTCETETAHDLEAWAIAFALPHCCAATSNPGALLFSGADDAAFKGWDLRAGGLERPTFVNRRAHAAGVTCVSPSPHDPHVVATGSYDDNLRLWDVRMMSRPVEMTSVNCGGGVWRCRWHPTRRRLACAAMGGGAAVVEWTINAGESEGAGEGEESGGEEKDEEEDVFRGGGGELNVVRSYEGHGSIAYGADWGWRRGGGDGGGRAMKRKEGEAVMDDDDDDVVVSCSFYDKGLHVWSPRAA